MRDFLVKSATVLATFATVSVPALAVEQARPDPRIVTRAEAQAKVQARFAAMDANRDGVVTKAEFDAYREARKAEWAARRDVRRTQRFDALDTNRDGQISREEYAAAGRTPGPGGKGGKHGMRVHGRGGHGWGGRGGDAFAAMDANRDGKVTLAEMSARPLAMFDRADTNRDGKVTPEERRAAHAAMRAERGGPRN